jgi:hypothetical protein
MPVDMRHVRSLANRVSELLIAEHRAIFELGKLINEVFAEDLWMHWPNSGPFKDRSDWCWRVLGFKQRKAENFRAIYSGLTRMGLAEDTLCRAMRLGWTKLYQVLRVADDEVQLLKWIDRIEDEKLSESALKAEVQILLAPPPAPDDEEKAPSEPATPRDAFEAAFGGDSGGSQSPDEADIDADEAQRRHDARAAQRQDDGNRGRIQFPMTFMREDDLRIFTKAIQVIRDRLNPDMGYGEAAGLMATAYLAALPRTDEGGVAIELEQLIVAVENTYGVRLSVVAGAVTDPETGAVTSVAAGASSSDEDDLDAAAADGF